MANQETAFGLRPVGLVGSATNSTGLTTYEISATNANAIFQYGLVTPTAGGVIDQAGATSGGTTAAVGVLMGVKYHDSTQKKPVFLNYWPGSGAVSVNTNFPVEAVVADNPNQLFAVAADANRPRHCFNWCFCKRVTGHVRSYWCNWYRTFQLST